MAAGTLHAAEQRIRVALGDNAGNVYGRINVDENFTKDIAMLMARGSVDPNWLTELVGSSEPDQLRARKIMGKNFFGIEEAIKYFGVRPLADHLDILSKIPWSEEVLEFCKDTHILVAVFPLSILDIRGITKRNPILPLFSLQDWYDKEIFAKIKGHVKWELVRKEPAANSMRKTWDDQKALLSKDEETPTARIVVYTMIGHFMANKERLFENFYVRCLDLASDGNRVAVGNFYAGGHSIHRWNDDYCNGYIGSSAAWKQ